MAAWRPSWIFQMPKSNQIQNLTQVSTAQNYRTLPIAVLAKMDSQEKRSELTAGRRPLTFTGYKPVYDWNDKILSDARIR